jgi:hypothetical protein
MLLKNFKLYVKDSKNSIEYQVYLNISVLNSGIVNLVQSLEN